MFWLDRVCEAWESGCALEDNRKLSTHFFHVCLLLLKKLLCACALDLQNAREQMFGSHIAMAIDVGRENSFFNDAFGILGKMK